MPIDTEVVSLISKTQLAILRSLSESPSHGYQLHKEVGVATSTVYKHLDELEAEGMVESSRIKDSNRDKMEYRITERGAELLELLDN